MHFQLQHQRKAGPMVSPIVAATAAGSAGASFLPGITQVAGPILGAIGSAFGGNDFSAYDHWQGLDNSFEDWRRRLHYSQKYDYYQRQKLMEQDAYFKQHDTENQFRWLVEGAQKAGFNPLTVLGAGGARTSPGPAISTPLGQQPGAAGFRRENSIGKIATAAGAIVDAFDPIERESRRLENELAQARLNQINSEQTRLGQGVPQVRRTESPVEVQTLNDGAQATEVDPYKRSPEDEYTQYVKVLGYKVPAYLGGMLEEAGGQFLGGIELFRRFLGIVAEQEHLHQDEGFRNRMRRFMVSPRWMNKDQLRRYLRSGNVPLNTNSEDYGINWNPKVPDYKPGEQMRRPGF